MIAFAGLFRGISRTRFSAGGEEDRAFLQRRCALFCRCIFFFGLATWLLRAGIYSARSGGFGPWLEQGIAAVVPFSAAIALIAWVLLRRGSWSHAALNLTEAGVTLALVVSTSLKHHFEDSPIAPGSLMAAFAAIIIFRAVVIPSSGMRTGIIGVLCALPVVLYVTFPGEFLRTYEAQDPRHLADTRSFFAPWIVIGVAISVVASNIIYGLRKQVAHAQRLGQYQLEERLGAGGMGEVYRASHMMLRRPTAVKLIRPDVAGEESLRRFETEVQVTASLTHPNTVAIYDYGRTPDGVFYYAMELLEGYDLQTMVERFGALPPGRVINVLRQACGSLQEAHAAGLIHRDIKPANMVLTRRGGHADVLKLVDFGLVKDLAGDDPELTAADSVMGTPQYIAPETLRSPDAVSAAVDIYALGCVGFFLLTGTPVFQSKSVVALCSLHLESKPDRPSERLGRDLPRDLEDLVLRCLSKARVERPDAQELEQALAALADADSWTVSNADDWWAAHPLPPREPQPRPRTDAAEDPEKKQPTLVVTRAAAPLDEGSP